MRHLLSTLMRINECLAFRSFVAYSPLCSSRFFRLPDSSDKSTTSEKQSRVQHLTPSKQFDNSEHARVNIPPVNKHKQTQPNHLHFLADISSLCPLEEPL